MRFVHDDDAHVFQGSEQRRPRPDDDAGLAALGAVPFVKALALPQGAVQQRQLLAEPRLEAPDHLRRQGDLGHGHDGRPPLPQRQVHAVQVDFGLAAARHPMHEEFAVLACRQPLACRLIDHPLRVVEVQEVHPRAVPVMRFRLAVQRLEADSHVALLGEALHCGAREVSDGGGAVRGGQQGRDDLGLPRGPLLQFLEHRFPVLIALDERHDLPLQGLHRRALQLAPHHQEAALLQRRQGTVQRGRGGLGVQAPQFAEEAVGVAFGPGFLGQAQDVALARGALQLLRGPRVQPALRQRHDLPHLAAAPRRQQHPQRVGQRAHVLIGQPLRQGHQPLVKDRLVQQQGEDLLDLVVAGGVGKASHEAREGLLAEGHQYITAHAQTVAQRFGDGIRERPVQCAGRAINEDLCVHGCSSVVA